MVIVKNIEYGAFEHRDSCHVKTTRALWQVTVHEPQFLQL